MSDWPEHGEELARKAIERIAADTQRFQDGTLSAKALWLVADILADVTQGLIDQESWNTIYAVRTEMTKQLKRQ